MTERNTGINPISSEARPAEELSVESLVNTINSLPDDPKKVQATRASLYYLLPRGRSLDAISLLKGINASQLPFVDNERVDIFNTILKRGEEKATTNPKEAWFIIDRLNTEFNFSDGLEFGNRSILTDEECKTIDKKHLKTTAANVTSSYIQNILNNPSREDNFNPIELIIASAKASEYFKYFSDALRQQLEDKGYLKNPRPSTPTQTIPRTEEGGEKLTTQEGKQEKSLEDLTAEESADIVRNIILKIIGKEEYNNNKSIQESVEDICKAVEKYDELWLTKASNLISIIELSSEKKVQLARFFYDLIKSSESTYDSTGVIYFMQSVNSATLSFEKGERLKMVTEAFKNSSQPIMKIRAAAIILGLYYIPNGHNILTKEEYAEHKEIIGDISINSLEDYCRNTVNPSWMVGELKSLVKLLVELLDKSGYQEKLQSFLEGNLDIKNKLIAAGILSEDTSPQAAEAPSDNPLEEAETTEHPTAPVFEVIQIENGGNEFSLQIKINGKNTGFKWRQRWDLKPHRAYLSNNKHLVDQNNFPESIDVPEGTSIELEISTDRRRRMFHIKGGENTKIPLSRKLGRIWLYEKTPDYMLNYKPGEIYEKEGKEEPINFADFKKLIAEEEPFVKDGRYIIGSLKERFSDSNLTQYEKEAILVDILGELVGKETIKDLIERYPLVHPYDNIYDQLGIFSSVGKLGLFS